MVCDLGRSLRESGPVPSDVEVDICMERAEGSWASFGVTRSVQVIKSALMAKVL
jgi:hypothetical protein